MRLDLLPFAEGLRRRREAGADQVWCAVRRRWLEAQPEELVRQALIAYLLERGYTTQLMQVERLVGRGRDRLDLLVLDRGGRAYLLVEVKAPGYPLQPATDQLARYNLHWRAPYTLALNGVEAICCAVDYSAAELRVLPALPEPPA